MDFAVGANDGSWMPNLAMASSMLPDCHQRLFLEMSVEEYGQKLFDRAYHRPVFVLYHLF